MTRAVMKFLPFSLRITPAEDVVADPDIFGLNVSLECVLSLDPPTNDLVSVRVE